MASKERIQRLKDENRINILEAALQIVKEDGWQALSMRKIADIIEYTAPMIYEYFASKEAILYELTNIGFRKLVKRMRDAKDRETTPEKQLEAMWLTYWNFAFENKEFYQLMYGVGMQCCEMQKSAQCNATIGDLVSDVIQEIMASQNPSEELICRKYYTYWSIIHGLISINLVNREVEDETNLHILKDAIQGITRSLVN